MSKSVKYELEFSFRASPNILFGLLSTSAGLTLWFADSANITDDVVTFLWDGNEETAYLLELIDNERIRYRWDHQGDDEYFEFQLSKSEVTGDTILKVIDFAEEYDLEDQRLLWEQQIKSLSTQVGG